MRLGCFGDVESRDSGYFGVDIYGAAKQKEKRKTTEIPGYSEGRRAELV